MSKQGETVNKQEAIERARRVEERIISAQAEMIELKKIIETPEPAGSLLTKPEPGDGTLFFGLTDDDDDGGLCSLACRAYSNEPGEYAHGNVFQSEVLADAYAEAINTLLLLRHQPGTEPAVDNSQYLIEMVRKDDKLQVKVIGRTDAASKMNKLSPCFDTFAHAVEAVETLGVPRLQHMFKTFHHIKD